MSASYTFGPHTVDSATLQSIISFTNAQAGEPDTDGDLDAFVDVYSDPTGTEFAEDYGAWLAARPAKDSPPTPTGVETLDVSAGVEKLSPIDVAIGKIIDIMVAHFDDESKRGMAVARKAFDHFVRVRKLFPGWAKIDFDSQCLRIRDGVRMRVSIKPESIRVADWVRAYVMRELARSDARVGDSCEKLSMFEWLSITGKGLKFDPVALSGEIKPCWIDVIRTVADARVSGERFTADQFKALVAATVTRVADLALGALSPEQQTKKLASAELAKDTAARAKSVKDLTETLDEGFKADTLSPVDAVAIMGKVAEKHGITLPSGEPTVVEVSVGFDPATCTVADTLSAVAVMFAAGKFTEMVALRDELDRVIAKVERMRSNAHRVSNHADPVSV